MYSIKCHMHSFFLFNFLAVSSALVSSVRLIERAPDSCSVLISKPPTSSGRYLSSAAQVSACYDSFPASRQDKLDHINALKGQFNIYPYKDIIKNSAAPHYDSNFDLFSSFDSILNDESIVTEHGMHNAVQDALTHLNDGHVSYVPSCFNSFYFYQPFNLIPVYNANMIDIVVDSLTLPSDETNGFWNASMQDIDPQDYVGARVISMNDGNPANFLQIFADKYNGIGHAPETRFNTLFPTYKWPRVNQFLGHSFSRQTRVMPLVSYTLQLANGQIISTTFEWLAVMWKSVDSSSFSSAMAYYAKNCIDPKASINPTSAPVKRSQIPSERMSKNDPTFASRRQSSVSALVDLDHPVASDDQGAFFMLNDGITGAWLLSTFSPAGYDYDGWFRNITQSLKALESRGATRLIIDVSNNGGGTVCYGWRLANYLFPRANLEPLQYQMRMTESLANIFVNNSTAATQASDGCTLTGGSITNFSTEFVNPGSTIPGYEHRFSNRFLINFENECALTRAMTPLRHGWRPQDVLLVSNGLCGSTCAQFTSLLRDQVGVRAVTYGGGPQRSVAQGQGLAFDPTAFAAGTVVAFADHVALFAANAWWAGKKGLVAGYPAETAEERLNPVRFKFYVEGQLPFFTTFSKFSSIRMPLEWSVDTSEFYLAGVRLNDPASIWGKVLEDQLFERPYSDQSGADATDGGEDIGILTAEGEGGFIGSARARSMGAALKSTACQREAREVEWGHWAS
ncbi:hypothetical protein BC830DRAFT_1222539 [Chytriomyces sp. MP71]|nr:hypothetical protein BC830DRAFT_1222539 [Chytriomyces sp. MP71]